MASGWHNKLARVSRMDWEEISTRVGQEFHKRSDLLRYRVGMGPQTIRTIEVGRPAGNFFFADGEAEKRGQLIRQHLREQAAEIVREADEICQHKFRLLGYENLDYGTEIDWHLDRVSGKRAPLDAWFKISFLDFAAVGDHKVTWELNRHQHLVTLAKAWLLTKDVKYVRELIAQWHSWVKANPYPLGINWGSTLEVAFRSLSWIWLDRLLSDGAPGGVGRHCHESSSTAEFRAELLPALAFHGRYIERYLSTYFSPNTHLLGEAVAMFFLGTLYAQMPDAERWKTEGWKIVLSEAGRQVRPDGVYFEQSLYYHVYALDFFLYARLLAAQNRMEIPGSYDDVLRRMLNVIEALAQAGPAEGFGDDDGGRLFDPRRNRTEHMTDPLALGVLAYKGEDLSAARLTEESIWIFGDRAVANLAQPKSHKTADPTTRSAAFPDGGLYVLAGAGEDSQSGGQAMMIDGGPQGVGRSGHGHADALSLRLAMNGSRWLVDSGSGVYISCDAADRNTLRGTAAHNTMVVDGVDQAVPDEPFSWTNIPTTRVEGWVTGKTFTYFAGSHDGYARLADPVTHRRSVLRVNYAGSGGDGLWLVRDLALGSAEHDLELRWHFASDLSVRETAAGELIASRRQPDSPTLRLIWPEQSAWKLTVRQGVISPAYGCYEPAPLARCVARIKLPAEIASAFIAQTGAEQFHSNARMVSTEQAAVHVYELHDGSDSHAVFFARDHAPWSFGPWSSDAEMLYCRTKNGKLSHLIVMAGTSVAWQGEALLSAPGPAEFLEWRKQDGIMNAAPVQFSTTRLFDELAGNLSSDASNATSSFAEKH